MFKKINIQLLTDTVYPVHNNKFYIGKLGKDSIDPTDMVVIKGMENFKPSFDSNTEKWSPMDLEGWARNAITGKGLSISLSGKRQYGDPGNDYVAGLMLSMGDAAASVFIWELPSGSKLKFNCVVSVTTSGGGDTLSMDALEFDILSDGIPVFTQTALAPLTFVCTDHATAGATQIASVSPVLTGGNSYMYKVNGGLPIYGELMTGKGWAAYTLAAAIPVVPANSISLIEVSAANLALKGGMSPAVIT